MLSVRLFARGLFTLGPAGTIRRAASDIQAREDDARYQSWLQAQDARAVTSMNRPDDAGSSTSSVTFSVIVPVFDTDPDLLMRCIDSVRRQTHERWELCICDDGSTRSATKAALSSLAADHRIQLTRHEQNRGIAAASNSALASATGDFIALLDHDDELAPDALAEVAERLASRPEVDVAYSDEDKLDRSGVRSAPHFKPDWSPELLRSCMYVSHLLVIRRSVVQEVRGFRDAFDGAQDYDLLLRVADRTERVTHIPRVLYHWRTAAGSAAESRLSKRWAFDAGARALADDAQRRDKAAEVLPAGAGGHYRVRYRIRGSPAISIVFLWTETAASASWLRQIRRRTAYPNVEYVCAYSRLPRILEAALDDANAARVHVRLPHAAPAYNAAANVASGEHLLFIAPDVRPLSGDWLTSLLEFSQQEEIGAVGPLIIDSAGRIETAGLVSSDLMPRDAFHGEPGWSLGHMANLVDVRNCSAVSRLCFMTRRAVFQQIGGLAEDLASTYDLDFGLRVRATGRRVVVTPHAKMRRLGSSGRETATTEERTRLRERWGNLPVEDPYYHPNFDRTTASFRLPISKSGMT